ncbi:MmcQ/YjbR family DNA-binding protein [Chitiniphilus eburneus]|uniref:MmcQ/YjbR family DNA-binding protein n=1 Tax=Chitiniphilus eburneus TaxID=2571148 RepID=A0A4U0Q7U6_9NEIS|nr:MmcQ/YjbR family DNA-binding protein [Chitiniphilus eburneus]TJZ77255.1 MmcQ/YjbR family DNA-binding protein [Chitiniphilus eburneus]
MTPARFREQCAAQAGATVDIKWGSNEVYSVGDKMFAIYGLEHGRIALKVAPERFLELTDRPGVHPAPYLARYYWVALDSADILPSAQLLELMHDSYRLVRARLPAKTRAALPQDK